jgi:ribosome-associated translation inhibitor RaiA
MDRPLEIAFHNLQTSESVEAEIRRHVERLETRYGKMIGCRVSIEALHKQHQTGNLFEVHIVMSLPGQELTVSHEPHHAKERRAHPDVRSAVKEAFKAAERQLEAHKSQKRDHDSPKQTVFVTERL